MSGWHNREVLQYHHPSRTSQQTSSWYIHKLDWRRLCQAERRLHLTLRTSWCWKCVSDTKMCCTMIWKGWLIKKVTLQTIYWQETSHRQLSQFVRAAKNLTNIFYRDGALLLGCRLDKDSLPWWSEAAERASLRFSGFLKHARKTICSITLNFLALNQGFHLKS